MTGVSIYDLMRDVREHPDYVFGTVFTVRDFDGGVPDDFDAGGATDALVEAGNDYIEQSAN